MCFAGGRSRCKGHGRKQPRNFVWLSRQRFDAVRAETLTFASEAYALLGDRVEGEAVLARAIGTQFISSATADQQRLSAGMFATRAGEFEVARTSLESIALDRPHGVMGFQTRVRFAMASLAVALDSPDAGRLVATSLHLAVRQNARLYASAARILQAACGDERTFSDIVARRPTTSRPASPLPPTRSRRGSAAQPGGARSSRRTGSTIARTVAGAASAESRDRQPRGPPRLGGPLGSDRRATRHRSPATGCQVAEGYSWFGVTGT